MTYKQWLPAIITSISDGKDTKEDKAGRKRKVKKGLFLLEYDDGFISWTHLHKEDFNCARVGSWRLDLDPADTPAEAQTEAEGEAESDQGAENEVESGADDEEGDGSDAEYDGDE